MADKSYQVLAPYVTLKVKDQAGSFVVVGYYAGGVITGEAEEESLRHHLDSKMLVEVSLDKNGVIQNEQDHGWGPGGAGAPEVTNAFDLIGSTDSDAPAKTASKEDWVSYAQSQGASDEELAGTKAELIEKYGA